MIKKSRNVGQYIVRIFCIFSVLFLVACQKSNIKEDIDTNKTETDVIESSLD